MNNVSSNFDLAAEIANIALDEFKLHHVSRNYTGLIQRYYQLVEEDYGGGFFHHKSFMRIFLKNCSQLLLDIERNNNCVIFSFV